MAAPRADTPESDCWRAASDGEALLHRFGEQTVVFVQETAATHWLEPAVADVFMTLRAAASPTRLDALLRSLGLAESAADASVVSALLDQLESLRLAMRCGIVAAR